MTVRIIPRLDIKGPNLVKGIHLEGLRVLGPFERFARLYYEQGADELIYNDIVASLYGRNSILEMVERTAREIFVPLTVSGGIRSLDDIRTALRAGADKVSLNTAAIARPELISEAARRFGSSTIVVTIEALRLPDGTWEALTDCGRQKTGVNAVEWAVRAAELGAGELLLTSIDREGTGKGFDLELTRKIADLVPIPVIASGGAGRCEHVSDVITEGHADAVALAGILHYDALTRGARESAIDHSREGNVAFLKSGARSSAKLEPASLQAVKRQVLDKGLSCRPIVTEAASG